MIENNIHIYTYTGPGNMEMAKNIFFHKILPSFLKLIFFFTLQFTSAAMHYDTVSTSTNKWFQQKKMEDVNEPNKMILNLKTTFLKYINTVINLKLTITKQL